MGNPRAEKLFVLNSKTIFPPTGADPGRGLWGLKPPPFKLMIFITLFCRPISRYCSQVGQVLLITSCNATQRLFSY